MDYTLLGLLGAAIFGFAMFDFFDSNDSDKDEAPDEDGSGDQPDLPFVELPTDEELPSPDESGIDLIIDGYTDASGTSGNDTLTIESVQDVAAWEPFDLGAGDDLAIINEGFVPVLGGEGNDTIIAQDVWGIGDGGAGDDLLIGVDGATLDGGEGNDSLNLIHHYQFGDYGAAALGGDGQDTITVAANALQHATTDASWITATGGEGEDLFHIRLMMNAPTGNPDTFNLGWDNQTIFGLPTDDSGNYEINSDDWPGQPGNFLTVSDFTSGEDKIVVELENPYDSETPPHTVTLEHSETEDGQVKTTVKVSFEGNDDYPAGSSAFAVVSDQPLELDDFTFVGF